jgi:hypothetical protein
MSNVPALAIAVLCVSERDGGSGGLGVEFRAARQSRQLKQ